MPDWLAALCALVRRHALFLVGLSLAFTFVRWPPLGGWDDSLYLAQLTSALADRDLLLHNDLLRLHESLDLKLLMLTTTLDSGTLSNAFSVGPAVLEATYTWPRMLRPGFTLSDRPHLPDRIVGLLVALPVVTGLTLAWKRLRLSARLRRLAVAAAACWGATALAWVTTLPVSARWNEAWRAVARQDSACETSPPLAASMEEARHVVCAARAERSGDPAGVARHLAALNHAVEFDVNERTLAAAVACDAATPPS